MFSKKCPKCENKIKKDFKFCPFCSKNLKSEYDQEDYGFLGKDDVDDTGFADTFVEKMINSVIKLFEKQMKNLHNEMNDAGHNPGHNPNNPSVPGLNVQFSVNGKKVLPEKKRTKQFVRANNYLSREKMKKLVDLPKKEPKSRIKRLSGKIIYEIFIPGVKNIDDILINQLENSIEIKAISNDKVYSKNLNVNLPILRYHLINDNLIIEMQAK